MSLNAIQCITQLLYLSRLHYSKSYILSAIYNQSLVHFKLERLFTYVTSNKSTLVQHITKIDVKCQFMLAIPINTLLHKFTRLSTPDQEEQPFLTDYR